MANNVKTAVATRNAMADLIGDNLNNGFVRVYDGTQPADADTAITTQNLLATATFGADAFGAAAGGIITANAISPDTSIDLTGTATWFRVVRSNGTTVEFDGTVGTSGADMNVNSVAFSAGASFSISSLTYTVPA